MIAVILQKFCKPCSPEAPSLMIHWCLDAIDRVRTGPKLRLSGCWSVLGMQRRGIAYLVDFKNCEVHVQLCTVCLTRLNLRAWVVLHMLARKSGAWIDTDCRTVQW